MPAYKMEYEYKDRPKSIIFDASYQEKILSIKSAVLSSIFFLICLMSYGQKNVEVSFHYQEDSSNVSSLFPNETLLVDSLQIDRVISKRLYNLYEMGYLAATSKKSNASETSLLVQFYTHQVFEVGYLSKGNVSEEILNKIGFETNNFENKPFSHRKLVRMLKSILDYAENHGYPFASIRLDSITIEGHKIGSWLNYQSGPMIVFDSVSLSGYERVKTKYLMSHLGIYKGKPYEEKIISEIPDKIKLLSFVSLAEDPEVIISNGKCDIILNLTQHKVSMLDGILGVLPNQKEGEGVLITGQLNLDLRNLFLSGKRLALQWQNYNVSSQLLDVLYFHSNLFRTPLSIQGDFHLLKQDTTFLNRKFGLEISLLSKNSNMVGFRSEFISTRAISTYGYSDISELPENTDYNVNYYGIDYALNKLNDANYPSRGFGVDINGSAGQKKILPNPLVHKDVYEDIELKSMQYRFVANAEKFWGIYKNIIFRTKVSGGYLYGDNLFQSDLFRIGGLNTLRGFTENQFYTSAYGIANLELRAIFSEGTYFILFFDQSVLADELDAPGDIQYPFGTGAGFSFNTKAGIFNFVFALGKSENQPFGLNYSKIHFGYISRF